MKQCFKCGAKKEESEFYTHPLMADGLLGKCKECTKQDSIARYARKRKELDWVLQERERCRSKQERYRKTHPDNPIISAKAKANWLMRNPHKRKCETAACNALRHGKIQRPSCCEQCGAATTLYKHHDDYTKPLKVTWLCSKCHGKRHHKMTL